MSESLTVDQAVSMLSADPVSASPSQPTSETNTDTSPTGAPDAGEHEFSEGAQPTPEDEADGAVTPTEGEEDGEVEAGPPPIEAPKFWDAEDKAAFANLGREDQERVLKYVKRGDQATSKAIEEASISRKAAEAVRMQAQAKLQELNTHVEQSAVMFVRKYDNIDWPAWFQTNPQLAAQAHAEFQQEQVVMRSLLEAKTKADADAEQTYLRSEAQALSELAKSDPVVAELMDANEGQARRTEVAQYLVKHGIPQDRLKLVSATEMSLARKAMLYDKAQEALKSKTAQGQHPSPRGSAPHPMSSGARAPVTRNQASVVAAYDRLSKTGSVDDAVALLNAREKNRRK